MKLHSAGKPHHKFNTNTRDTTRMADKGMTDRRFRGWRGPGPAARIAVLRLAAVGTLAWGLGACASGPSSSVFVDPATYELYNCKQLGTARTSPNNRVIELEGLMAKAESGAAGSLVSGLAYQTDYLTQRARRDQIHEKIASNHCTPADLAAPDKADTPSAPQPSKRRR
jgi:hypothetical protein